MDAADQPHARWQEREATDSSILRRPHARPWSYESQRQSVRRSSERQVEPSAQSPERNVTRRPAKWAERTARADSAGDTDANAGALSQKKKTGGTPSGVCAFSRAAHLRGVLERDLIL